MSTTAEAALHEPESPSTYRDAPAGVQPLLELREISKRFGAVQALHRVGLTLQAGEIVAIVGENGAGKSTLLKILGGVLHPDEGEFLIHGQRTTLHGVRSALALGIALIHQELNLATSITVAENLFLGRLPHRGPPWLPFTNRRQLYHAARRELRRVGLDVAPSVRLSRLSIAQRQLVEIAKALATDARLLILDEPTSSLSLKEADRLLNILAELRRRGAGILYVSHRLREVQQVADRAVVLRDGCRVGELSRHELSSQRLISLMVGREMQPMAHRQRAVAGEQVLLAVKNLRRKPRSPAVSFELRPGEIVGLAGIVGSGRTEIVRAIFGIEPCASGQIWVGGRQIQVRHPRQAIEAGLALVPEDRKALGVITSMPVRSNISLAILSRLARFGRYSRAAERAVADAHQRLLDIRCANLEAIVSSLSGGNQQKVVIAKWLAMRPKVLILDEPTRGVDIGAKLEIYGLIYRLAEQGTGILLISSEMEEIITLSDRVLVIHQESVAAELQGNEITEDNIMRSAVGLEQRAEM